MTEERRALIVEILRELPVSIRALGQAAGISHVSLIRARDGEQRLSDDAARRIIDALRKLGDQCQSLADRLEDSANEDPRRGASGSRGRRL